VVPSEKKNRHPSKRIFSSLTESSGMYESESITSFSEDDETPRIISDITPRNSTPEGPNDRVYKRTTSSKGLSRKTLSLRGSIIGMSSSANPNNLKSPPETPKYEPIESFTEYIWSETDLNSISEMSDSESEGMSAKSTASTPAKVKRIASKKAMKGIKTEKEDVETPKEKQKDKEKQIEKETPRESETQKEKETPRERETQKEKPKEKETKKNKEPKKEKEPKEKQKDKEKQIEKETPRESEAQKEKETPRESETQKEKPKETKKN